MQTNNIVLGLYEVSTSFNLDRYIWWFGQTGTLFVFWFVFFAMSSSMKQYTKFHDLFF